MTEEKAIEVEAQVAQSETASDKGSEKVEKAEAVEAKVVSVTDVFAECDVDSFSDDLESLVVAGAHFGHQKSRRHPRMIPYIFDTRGGINIIDLEQTQAGIRDAQEFLVNVRRSGKKILFVTTKQQVLDLVRSAAVRAAQPFVIDRWLGGTFTNFPMIRKRVKYLMAEQEQMEKGAFGKYTKFEQLKKSEEIEKLNNRMGGLKTMTELPGAIVVADVKSDALAVREARLAGVPVVAITDTNVNPTLVDYVIPANDDAISSLKLIFGLLVKTIVQTQPMETKEAKAPAPKPQSAQNSAQAGKSEKPAPAKKSDKEAGEKSAK